MPWSNNSGGGPWGGGDDGRRGGGRGGGPGGGGSRSPDIDEILQQGRDRLKVIMGGGGGKRRGGGSGGGGGGIGKGGYALIAAALFVIWLFVSFYTVKPEERAVELFLGEQYQTEGPGLSFAPWPVVSAEILPVTTERTVNIGINSTSSERRSRQADQGLMLTGDENIVDIDFQVVWNIRNAEKFLFNLASPQETIRAVSVSAMREVIARSELGPILNRDRALVSQDVQAVIQDTMDSYDSGIDVLRVNFDRADPPPEVIDAFRDVQAAEQDRDTSEKQADAYANERLASARGEAAELLQQAEGYRARLVNEAEGQASRFTAIYNEFAKAPEVTRKRLYLETLERVLGGVDKVIIDEQAAGGQGVVPYLPLNELNRGGARSARAGGSANQ